MAALLLEKGANPRISAENKLPPLYTALRSNADKNTIKSLLSHKANVHNTLEFARKNNDTQLIAANLVNSDFKDKRGCSVLHLAIEEGHFEDALLLLEKWAAVNTNNNEKIKAKANEADDEQWTLLHYCANQIEDEESFEKIKPLIKRLLEFGADPSKVDNKGRTATHPDYIPDEALRDQFVAYIKSFFPSSEKEEIYPILGNKSIKEFEKEYSPYIIDGYVKVVLKEKAIDYIEIISRNPQTIKLFKDKFKLNDPVRTQRARLPTDNTHHVDVLVVSGENIESFVNNYKRHDKKTGPQVSTKKTLPIGQSSPKLAQLKGKDLHEFKSEQTSTTSPITQKEALAAKDQGLNATEKLNVTSKKNQKTKILYAKKTNEKSAVKEAIVAHLMGMMWGMDRVPKTKVFTEDQTAQTKTSHGILSRELENAEALKSHFLKVRNNKKEPLTQVQLINAGIAEELIVAYVFRDRDPHAKNILFKKESNGQLKLCRIDFNQALASEYFTSDPQEIAEDIQNIFQLPHSKPVHWIPRGYLLRPSNQSKKDYPDYYAGALKGMDANPQFIFNKYEALLKFIFMDEKAILGIIKAYMPQGNEQIIKEKIDSFEKRIKSIRTALLLIPEFHALFLANKDTFKAHLKAHYETYNETLKDKETKQIKSKHQAYVYDIDQFEKRFDAFSALVTKTKEKEKENLLKFLENYQNNTKDNNTKSAVNKLIAAIKGNNTVQFDEEDKKQLNAVSVCTRLFYFLGNNYKEIIPKDIQTILKDSQNKYIKLKELLTQKQKITALNGELQSASSKQSENYKKLNEKSKIYERFCDAILSHNETAQFSLKELALIQDLVPANIFKDYKVFLPSQIKEFDPKINWNKLRFIVDFERQLNAINLTNNPYRQAQKQLFIELLKEDISHKDTIDKIMAHAYAIYSNIKEPDDALSQKLEELLLDLLPIEQKAIEKAKDLRKGESWPSKFYNFFVSDGKKPTDPVFKLIKEMIDRDYVISKQYLPVVNSARKFMVIVPPKLGTKTNNTTQNQHALFFAHQKKQTDLLLNNHQVPLAMKQLWYGMLNYLNKHQSAIASHSRQLHAKYLGNFAIQFMENTVNAKFQPEKDKIFYQYLIEVFAHWNAIKDKSSDVKYTLGAVLRNALNIKASEILTIDNISKKLEDFYPNKAETNKSNKIEKDISNAKIKVILLGCKEAMEKYLEKHPDRGRKKRQERARYFTERVVKIIDSLEKTHDKEKENILDKFLTELYLHMSAMKKTGKEGDIYKALKETMEKIYSINELNVTFKDIQNKFDQIMLNLNKRDGYDDINSGIVNIMDILTKNETKRSPKPYEDIEKDFKQMGEWIEKQNLDPSLNSGDELTTSTDYDSKRLSHSKTA